MDAKPLELRTVTSFMVKGGTASDHSASPPVVEHTVTQFTPLSKWPLSTWFWSECPCKPHACPRCLRRLCLMFLPFARPGAGDDPGGSGPWHCRIYNCALYDAAASKARIGLCWEHSSNTHLQYILIAGSRSGDGLYAAHMSSFRRPWRLYNQLVIAGRLAGLIPIQISWFVISRNRLICTWRASVWYSTSLEFSFLSCFVLQLSLALGMSHFGIDLHSFRPWFFVLSLPAPGFGPEPIYLCLCS
jgi:hypothetical protein